LLHLINLEGCPIMPTVHLDVHPFKVGKGGLSGSPVLHHPAAETLHGLEIEV
jgi:hypothetical protein